MFCGARGSAGIAVGDSVDSTKVPKWERDGVTNEARAEL